MTITTLIKCLRDNPQIAFMWEDVTEILATYQGTTFECWVLRLRGGQYVYLQHGFETWFSFADTPEKAASLVLSGIHALKNETDNIYLFLLKQLDEE